MSLLPDRVLIAATALSGMILLTGCAAENVKGAESANAASDACGAEGYQSLVGQALAAVTLPASLKTRIIQPDDLVTQDYVEERLNIETDTRGTIMRVFCG